jgi:alpha-1,3-rhamnosyl/mannosyltransferase
MMRMMMSLRGVSCHKTPVYHILVRMRVAIDASPLLVRSAGVKNYLYYWIEHLRRRAGDDVIRLFPPLGAPRALDHESSAASPARTFFSLGALALANYTPLPILDFATRGCDLFHATNLVRHPPRRPRLTATIHDMTSWLMPELHTPATRRADAAAAETFRRAHRLIAVSEATKRDAVRILNIPPDRIEVIHSGVAPAFFDVQPAAIESVRARYGLVKPFVFALGAIEPRKNIPALIAAFEALPPSIREHFDLVLAGPMAWAPPATAALVREGHTARYLGYIPEPDLPAVTAAATVFACPSLYEGFGFPLAQAMAAGVPSIASNVSSLPEIAGDAAILIDPRSLSDLRDALERLLLSADLRADLAAKGRARVRRFTWENTAAQSLNFLERALG